MALLHPDNPAALKSGFTLEVVLRRGRNPIVIEAKIDGIWRVIERMELRVPWFPGWIPPKALPPDDYATTIRQWLDAGGGLPGPDDGLAPEENGPSFGIVMPVFNPQPAHLLLALDSVRAQTWPKWELIAVNDASTDPRIAGILDQAAREDSRIRVLHRSANGHIATATNEGLALVRAEFVVFMDHDDLLVPEALAVVAQVIKDNPGAVLLYSDEDHIDETGIRANPTFKPDFQLELLLSQNYIGHLVVCRRTLIPEIGGLHPGLDGSQDWDFVLRASTKCNPEEILHIPRILYHWRMSDTSTAKHGGAAKPYALEAGRRAVENFLSVSGSHCEVNLDRNHRVQVRWPLPNPAPGLSLVIPTRNRSELLQQCMNSLRQIETYAPLDVVIVDNGSDDPDALALLDSLETQQSVTVLRVPGEFNFSRLVNRGVQAATGPVVALVNNDIEFRHPEALREMVSHAIRPDVGAVGAKLLYPDGRIQHAGVFLGHQGSAGHFFRGLDADWEACGGRAGVVWRVSAVTAAMLVVRRDIFLDVGGFDEAHFPVVYNDVDFCLRLAKAGLRTIYTPHAVFVHHESASRGKSTGSRGSEDLSWKTLAERHRGQILADPCFHPQLSLEHEDLRPALHRTRNIVA